MTNRIGSEWRILAHGRTVAETVDVRSKDSPWISPPPYVRNIPHSTVFDELVISFPGGAIHLEQMSTRTWFLGVGEDKWMIHVGRDGVPRIGERYR